MTRRWSGRIPLAWQPVVVCANRAKYRFPSMCQESQPWGKLNPNQIASLNWRCLFVICLSPETVVQPAPLPKPQHIHFHLTGFAARMHPKTARDTLDYPRRPLPDIRKVQSPYLYLRVMVDEVILLSIHTLDTPGAAGWPRSSVRFGLLWIGA